MVRNRSRERVSETLEVFLAGGSVPVASWEVDLGPRASTSFEFDLDLSGPGTGERLELLARAGPAETRAWIRTERQRSDDDGGSGDDGEDGEDDDDRPDPPPSTDDSTWLAGKELHTANCAACHGDTGSRIRRESPSEWIEVVAKGEDDEDRLMPAFPGLTAGDVAAMRIFVNDPNRVVDGGEPPPPPPPPPPGDTAPTYDVDVAPILTTRCTACLDGSLAAGGIALHTFATAFANRAALVDSVEQNRMPPSSPLPAGEKATLREWLDAGAPRN